MRPLLLPPLLALTAGLLAALPAQASPYSDDSEHPANRLFRAIYTVELVPTKIGAALASEHGDDEDFFVPKWYFRTRPGTAEDRKVYGGDGRQVPRERFSAPEADAVHDALTALDGTVLADLRQRPRLAVYLQYDLFRLARRLVDAKANPDLLAPLHAAATRLALPAATLRSAELATFELKQITPHLKDCKASDLVELDRRSTRLFDAGRTGLWSELWLTVAARHRLTVSDLIQNVVADEEFEVPLDTTAVLVQGIVALGDDGNAYATRIVTDVRLQRLTNLQPLARDNPTTTHDGVDLAQWLLPREKVRKADSKPISFAWFDSIPMTRPELFRDYGSLKYTPYFAQCALCHRRTNTPDGNLGGFSVLRRSARPQITQPGHRRELAQRQFLDFVGQLPR
ncbi:MAG: hypothetical protein NXI31_16850 [bacterium]|nr:hypothetical protein [bacterium]